MGVYWFAAGKAKWKFQLDPDEEGEVEARPMLIALLFFFALTSSVAPQSSSKPAGNGKSLERLAPVGNSLDESKPRLLIKKWELKTQEPQYRDLNWPRSEDLAAFSDEAEIAFGMSAGEGLLQFFDPHTGKSKVGAPPIAGIAPLRAGYGIDAGFFSADATRFYLAKECGLRAWEVKTAIALFSIVPDLGCIGDAGPLNSREIAILVDARPGSTYTPGYAPGYAVELLDSVTGKETGRLDLGPGPDSFDTVSTWHLVTSPTAHLFAVSMGRTSGEITVRTYREDTLKPIRTISIQPSDLGFSTEDPSLDVKLTLTKDGRYLAVHKDYWLVGDPNTPVLVYDTETAQKVGSYFGGADFTLDAFSFSPDGVYLIAAGSTGYSDTNGQWRSTYRTSVRIDVYDWKRSQLTAQARPELSWDEFQSVFMLSSGEVLVQLGDRILCFSP